MANKNKVGRIFTEAKNLSILRWVNILAFILTIVVNGLAGSTTLIGGKVTAEVSNANPTLITPAGYVFTIWGIIYILLGAFVIYQALPRTQGRTFQKKIGWLFVLSSAFNVAWIFLWQYEYLSASIVMMFLLLSTLSLIYLRLGAGKPKVLTGEKLAVHIPFSVYLGWITVASIANVAVALVAANWDGFGISAQIWATIAVAIALLAALSVIAVRRDVAYALVIIWALVGIGVNQSQNQTVVMLTTASTVIIAVALTIAILFTRVKWR